MRVTELDVGPIGDRDMAALASSVLPLDDDARAPGDRRRGGKPAARGGEHAGRWPRAAPRHRRTSGPRSGPRSASCRRQAARWPGCSRWRAGRLPAPSSTAWTWPACQTPRRRAPRAGCSCGAAPGSASGTRCCGRPSTPDLADPGVAARPGGRGPRPRRPRRDRPPPHPRRARREPRPRTGPPRRDYARSVGALGEAADFLSRATECAPHDWRLWLELDEVRAWLGRRDAMEQAWEQALALLPAPGAAAGVVPARPPAAGCGLPSGRVARRLPHGRGAADGAVPGRGPRRHADRARLGRGRRRRRRGRRRTAGRGRRAAAGRGRRGDHRGHRARSASRD